MKRVVYPLLFVFLLSCGKDDQNQSPVALFTIHPVSGDQYTYFEFNGAESSDPDGPDTLLKYRWDWESDGYYDQLYDRNPFIRHRFEQEGAYEVTMQVMDQLGAVATTSLPVLVSRGSLAPLEPFSPNPKDSSNNILYTSRLSWLAIDPDDDRMWYDIYLGSIPDPPLWKARHDTTFVAAEGLESGLTWYWKIVAHDSTGLQKEGPVWRFSIHSGDYETDTLTDTRDGQVYQTLKLGRIWWMTENLRYDLKGLNKCLNDLPENCDRYGRYYLNGLRDTLLCPAGWTLPDQSVMDHLEQLLGMCDSDRKLYGVWRGNDQGSQIAPGGTSGLNVGYTGYLDADGNWKEVNQAAVLGSNRQYHFPTRMIRKGYGGILRGSMPELSHAPVRCIRYE